MDLNTFEVLGIPMTMDEAQRLADWLKADSGKHFWRYLQESKKAVYDSFTGKHIENPISEILSTQRQKAELALLDTMSQIPTDVEESIRVEVAIRDKT